MPEPLDDIKTMIWEALPDRAAIALQYYRAHGRFPNLKAPKTFTEKVQYRKLNDRDPRLPLFADKIRAKELVALIIGDEYIIPTLWSGKYLNIPKISELPRPIVIKASHGCASNIFVHEGDKPDWSAMWWQCQDWLRTPYGTKTREWLYEGIERQILVEPMIGNGKQPPSDYKFFVFHGQVTHVHVDIDRYGDQRVRAILDKDWQRLDVKSFYPNAPYTVDRPDRFEEMKRIAEKIGKKFDFVRVDLYDVDGRIYFGETTFYPASGYLAYDPPSFDAELGAAWKVPA